MIYLLIPLALLIIKQIIVNRLRKKRDRLNLRTWEGKQECLRLNKKINALNLVFWK